MLPCMGVLWTQQDGTLVRHVILHHHPFFSFVELVSLLQLYATTGMSHIFPQQHQITAVMAVTIDNEKCCKPEC